MIIKEIDFTSSTIDEITTILKNNIFESNKMKKEIEKIKELELLELAKSISEPYEEKLEEQELLEEIECDETEDDFTNTVNYYYNDIKEIFGNDIESQMRKALPSKKNTDYHKIVKAIKLNLITQISEINEFIKEYNGKDKEDLIILRQEVEENKIKLQIIEKIKNEKEEIIADEEENNLIFTYTSGGNVRALEEIDSIDPEFYKRFIGLFDSIKNNTFKNVKKFTKTNNITAGFSEVKDHQVRIVFDRISYDDYAIIAVFIKKTDKDKKYMTQLSRKIVGYKLQKNGIIENYQDEDFILKNKKIETEVYDKLKIRVK